MRRALLTLSAFASLVACERAEQTKEAPSQPSTPAAEIASARPAAFAQCAVCHSDKQGDPDRQGPNLFGVFGTKAGTHAAGFGYSPAMKSANVTWDRATLDAYIELPPKVVPGTRMIYMGQKDPAKRKAIIDYLETLR